MKKIHRYIFVFLISLMATNININTVHAKESAWKTVIIKTSRGDRKVYIPNDLTKRCPQWEPLFKEYELPTEVFSYIAWRESRCRSIAINARFDKYGKVVWTLNKNRTYDSGLLQINSSWRTLTKQVCKTNLEGLLKANCNVKVASVIYNEGKGIGNWSL